MNHEPEKIGREQAGRFRKGQSGNPAGKPKGARHKSTILAEKLMADDVGDEVRAVVAAAKGGDMTAARLVLDRIAPPRKGCAINLDLPPIQSATDVAAAMGIVVEAVADGELTPDEGQAVAALLETRRRAIETADLEMRIAAIEAQTKGQRR